MRLPHGPAEVGAQLHGGGVAHVARHAHALLQVAQAVHRALPLVHGHALQQCALVLRVAPLRPRPSSSAPQTTTLRTLRRGPGGRRGLLESARAETTRTHMEEGVRDYPQGEFHGGEEGKVGLAVGVGERRLELLSCGAPAAAAGEARHRRGVARQLGRCPEGVRQAERACAVRNVPASIGAESGSREVAEGCARSGWFQGELGARPSSIAARRATSSPSSNTPSPYCGGMSRTCV
eukprot:scaffold701_cov351-Prasinococcus_capsulatus_cf.AAC.6